MRERFDAGTGLVALGAVLLLISLFVDWFDPSGDAWAVFELADVVLAACALAGLVAIIPRYTGLGRAVPAIAFAALVIVAVQLVDPPPSARGDRIDAGAWLALGATLLMAAGAALSAASISITVDVRGRERRRRTAAIDAREAAAAAEASDGRDDAAPTPDARRARRRGGAAPPSPAGGERRPGPGPGPGPGAGPPPAGAEPPTTAAVDQPPLVEPPDDPDRTQALDPVDRPKDGP
ncbi:MAG: hypothetical protein QOF29_2455 [bacterium]